jgi:MATE family multidrug resistance protein
MTLTPGHPPARPAARSIGEHLRRTVRLALPVMLGRMGILLLVAVDTAMTGHAGALELAFYGLAISPQVPMLLVGIGLLMGTVVLTAQANGAGATRECGHVWRMALVQAAVIGTLMMGLCYAGEPFLLATGQAPELAAGGGRVLVVLGWGLPGMLLYSATTFFLEGIDRPTPGMLVMIAANLLNLLLNWVFIYGELGAPAMGAEGAALATSIVRWFMFAAIAAYVLRRIDRDAYGLRAGARGVDRLGRRMLRIGLPMGLAHGLESGAFSAMVLFAGLLGPTQVAGYLVAMNLVALAFMNAIGLATAASVRVGNSVGRGDTFGIRVAGWVAVCMTAAVMVPLAALYHGVPSPLAAVYANDPAVLAVAAAALSAAAFVLLPDGVQGVLMGALRGVADVWIPTGLYLFSFWGVMVPAGYVMGVQYEGGAPSLMHAVLIGTVVAAVLLGTRFHAVSRRAVERA